MLQVVSTERDKKKLRVLMKTDFVGSDVFVLFITLKVLLSINYHINHTEMWRDILEYPTDMV